MSSEIESPKLLPTEPFLIYPAGLKSSQPNEAPHVEKMLPYNVAIDTGIDIGIDEYGDLWTLNGHNRAAAALMEGKQVKVGSIKKVTSQEMWELLDG